MYTYTCAYLFFHGFAKPSFDVVPKVSVYRKYMIYGNRNYSIQTEGQVDNKDLRAFEFLEARDIG